MLLTRVADEIRAAILSGDLPPGTPVKQEQLAAQLGVSREPVRKALLLLEREGLVRADPNRSATVAPLDRRFIEDIYQFREGVEGLVAAELAARADLDLAPLDRLVAGGRAAVAAGELTQLIELDMAFHTSLYDAAGNRVIIDVMRGQWSHIRRVMAVVLAEVGYRSAVWQEHAAIVEAIRARRPGRARALAARHTRGARRMLLAGFDAATSGNSGTA
jgi:DNA-binding GntR family transcriptional regulator